MKEGLGAARLPGWPCPGRPPVRRASEPHQQLEQRKGQGKRSRRGRAGMSSRMRTAWSSGGRICLEVTAAASGWPGGRCLALARLWLRSCQQQLFTGPLREAIPALWDEGRAQRGDIQHARGRA